MKKRSSAETFWDREVVEPTHNTWMEHPRIQQYILRSISGSASGLWPVDWFIRWVGRRRFKRGLSIGCGTGALERDVVVKGLVEQVDAFDGSTNSLRVAQQTAAAEGLTARIHYYAADFNNPVLPRSTYDIVFVHQALHHVERLERLLSEIMLALTDDGILYLDEYIGPSRTEWNRSRIKRLRTIFEALPSDCRTEVLPLPIQKDDPSEAVRSGEIIRRLEVGFDVKAMRGYGGNLLSVVYPYIDLERLPGGVDRIIDQEQKMLASGMPPFYAVIVARPKRGMEGERAISTYAALDVITRLRRAVAPYVFPPILSRIGRKIRRRLRRKP